MICEIGESVWGYTRGCQCLVLWIMNHMWEKVDKGDCGDIQVGVNVGYHEHLMVLD